MRTKKPYEKPELRIIELVADEVLAAGCKVTGQTGPRTGKAACANLSGECFRAGS